MKMFLSMSVLLFSLSSQAYTFGSRGSHGSSGRDGSDGRSGQNITIKADGNPYDFDLRGSAGSDAGDGRDGGNATACSQGRPSHNLTGADGGNGGRGGKGGDGGHGGTSLIFYQDYAQLKPIKILNDGASGGDSGRGGDGGDPCHCSTSSWTIKECHTHNGEKECTNHTYHCTSGSRGSRGSSPSDGSAGFRGGISLVKNLEALPLEFPTASSTLGKLNFEAKLLSKRMWDTKSGARQLFHPSSSISDTFSEFNHLSEKTFRIVWKAQRSVEPFMNVEVDLSFDGHEVTATLGDGILFKGNYIRGEKEDQYVITHAFLPQELDQLEIGKPTGSLDKLQIEVKDNVHVTTLVENKVITSLVFKRWLIGHKTAFYGEVPSDLLEITDDGFILHLGRLPGIKAQKFKPKRKITLEMDVMRSFGGRTVIKHLSLPEIKIPEEG